MRSPTIPEESTVPSIPTIPATIAPTATAQGQPAAEKVKEQKITPFDVEGGVDADGKEMAM
jgi:tryptophanyl-tRNA synthetase